MDQNDTLPDSPAAAAAGEAPRVRSAVRPIALSLALSFGLVAAAAWFVADELDRLGSRLVLLETDRQGSAVHQEQVRSGLNRMGDELGVLSERIGAAAEEARAARAVAERLHAAEERLGTIGKAVEAATTSLSSLEDRVGPEDLSSVLTAREGRLREHWQNIEQHLREEVSKSKERLQEVEGRMAQARDLDQMWSELMGPVVQLAGESSVGSGVLLSSEPQPGGRFRTYLLTAWHVVRDIQGSPTRRNAPVPVTIYGADGALRHEEATLLVYDADLDAALLQLVTPDALPHGAKLAGLERIDRTQIFDRVYAVGCPLGNDPIPTYGEIATRSHVVDGETYWMINAPTYIGNSGGGIFDGETHELVGIFSKIYTHGSLRPTIVPHMGLVTPLSAVYDWLDSQGYANVHAAAGEDSTARVASVPR